MLSAQLLLNEPNLVIQHFYNGIKLMHDESARSPLQSNDRYSFHDFLNLPLKIAFLNLNSNVIYMNELNANAWGYESTKKVIGKSITNVYDPRPAAFSLNHDKRVIKLNQLIIEEENCLRADEVSFQAITAKMPLYNDNNRIAGVVAMAMTLGLNDSVPIQNSIEAFANIISATKKSKTHYFKPSQKHMYLTTKEREILFHTMKGKTARIIAETLHLSRRTIETHLENLKIKMNVSSKHELIEKSFQLFNFFE